MKRLLFIGMFIILASGLHAQFVLQGEFRPRFEYRSGYRNIIAQNQDDAVFVSQRTRLNLYYTMPRVSFGLSIQDVRVWGDETLVSSNGVFGDAASLDLNEGWINIILYPKGNLKMGRQFWAYEDERILSVRNWNQSQVKYDGVLFQHNSNGFRIDVALSWNSSLENIYGNNYPSDRMKTMNFIYIRKKVADWASISGTAFLSGFARTDTTPEINLQQTYAGYLNINQGDLSAIVSGFYQAGLSRKGRETSAYMFSVKGKYNLGAVTLGAGIDYLSGNDAAREDASYQDKEHSFDLLYGNTHGYYGHLDLFSSMQKATASGGLVDIFLNFSWKFVPKATFNTDLHYFTLQNNVVDKLYEGQGVQYLDKALGPEADLNVSWDILDFLNLKGGYSFMLPTSSMEALQGIVPGESKPAQWVWVMITAKPVFFDSSK